jgi:hypothetical protein
MVVRVSAVSHGPSFWGIAAVVSGAAGVAVVDALLPFPQDTNNAHMHTMSNTRVTITPCSLEQSTIAIHYLLLAIC